MTIIKKLIWFIKRQVDTFYGTTLNEYYWRFRHIFNKRWAEKYLARAEDENMPDWLGDAIAKHTPFTSLLEIGSATGINLYWFKKTWPESHFYGVDISKTAITLGNDWFASHNIKDIKLLEGRADNLRDYKDESIDIVFSSATLIYIGPDKIDQVIKEMLRVARRAVILVEWASEAEYEYKYDHWAYNWQLLFKKHGVHDVSLTKIESDTQSGGWQELGYIINVYKSN